MPCKGSREANRGHLDNEILADRTVFQRVYLVTTLALEDSVANRGIVLLSIAAGGTLVWKLEPPAAVPVITFKIDLPEGQTFNGNTMPNVAISRGGTRIAYAANLSCIPGPSQVEAHAIAGTESTTDVAVVAAPAFSPDGRSIAFYSSGSIKTIPIEGGTVTIGTVSRLFGGIKWTTGPCIRRR